MKRILLVFLVSLLFVLAACARGPSSPANLAFAEDTISWLGVEGADHYEVKIDGATHETEETSFDVSFLPPGDYTVTIRTVLDGRRSSPSEELPFSIFGGITKNMTFNVRSEYDLKVHMWQGFTFEAITLDGDDVDGDHFRIEDGILVIEKEYLQTLAPDDEERYAIHVEGNDGELLLNLKIVDQEKPHLVSSPSFAFVPGQDIHFYFEVLDGDVSSLNPPQGIELDEDDYTVEGNLLIIHHEFIERIKQAEPDREMLIMSLFLQNAGHITISHLFISLP